MPAVDARRPIHWLALANGKYELLATSGLLDLGAIELAARIDWPEPATR